jgi:hypothetical protein
MSTGILSDIVAGFLLIVDWVVSDSLLIVDCVIWFLDFWEKRKRGFLPLSCLVCPSIAWFI